MLKIEPLLPALTVTFLIALAMNAGACGASAESARGPSAPASAGSVPQAHAGNDAAVNAPPDRSDPGEVGEAGEMSNARPQPRVREPKRITLPRPPFVGTYGPSSKASSPPPALVEASRQKNGATDPDAWFRTNDLPRLDHAFAVPGRPTPFPDHLALENGTFTRFGVIESGDQPVAIYGETPQEPALVLILNEGKPPVVFDFSAYRDAPTVVPADADFVRQGVRWAELHNGILYVETGHRTYARSSHGANAFITAVDASSGALVWRSAPLVANAVNFIKEGDYLITGYGFTQEPDFLFLLDATTGRTVKRIPVASGPEYLVRKAGRLYVRTYDHDYVFDVR